MRNGIRSEKLTLVDSCGDEIRIGADQDDIAVEYLALQDATAAAEARISTSVGTLIVVSAACAAASIATGVYAYWLFHHAASATALSDVHDLLKSCQNQMTQLEDNLDRVSERISLSS